MQRLSAILFVFFTLNLLGLSAISCQSAEDPHQIDLDNLYTIRLYQDNRDSISQQLKPLVVQLLNTPKELTNGTKVDSLLRITRTSNLEKPFLQLAQSAKKQAIQQDNYKRQGQIEKDIAVYYELKQQLDSAYYHYQKAANIYRFNQNELAYAESLFYQARILYTLGFKRELDIKTNQVLKLLASHKPTALNIEALNLMAYINFDNNNLDQAKDYLDQAYQLLIDNKKDYHILPKELSYIALTNAYSNYALYYNYTEENDLSEAYSNKAFEQLEHNYQKALYSFINIDNQLARYYQGKNPFVIQGLMQSYAIQESLGNAFYKADFSYIIAEIYSDLGQKDQALEWGHKSYQIAKDAQLFAQQKAAIEFILLHDADHPTKVFVKELIALNTALENKRNSTREEFAKIEFESLALIKENKQLKQHITLIAIASAIIVIPLLFLFFYTRLKNKNKALLINSANRQKNEQILNLLIENNAIEHKAIVQERLRISKDLHDSVVNSVFVLRFNVQQLQVENQQMKQSLVNELSNLETTVRGISHSLVKSNIVNNGFEQLLSELIERQINSHNTKFTLQIDKDLPLSDLSIQQKANVYHIIQEALQNVNKHAQASLCEVSIKSYHDQIIFKVKDNGKGIQKNQLYTGIGIQNMHERANHIQAELTIRSIAHKNTEISLIV